MRLFPAACMALCLTATLAAADTPILECLSGSHYATVSETDRPGSLAMHLMGVDGDMSAQVVALADGLSIDGAAPAADIAVSVILRHDGSAALSVLSPDGVLRSEQAECIGQQSFLDGYAG